MTNTNWQSYGGETTMSHLTQMIGLTVQNFVSAAAGMAVMAAFIRGLARRRAKTLGNFWVDLTRSTVRILLPLALARRRGAHQPRRDPELPRAHRRDDRGGLFAGARRRTGRQADRHQAVGNQRRRLLQRQLGPPVRELDAVRRLRRDVLHRDHPVRPGVHVRAHGQGPTAGPRRVRHHGRDLGAVVGRGDGVGGQRQPQPRRRSASTSRSPPTRQGATSRARRSASAPAPRRSGR